MWERDIAVIRHWGHIFISLHSSISLQSEKLESTWIEEINEEMERSISKNGSNQTPKLGGRHNEESVSSFRVLSCKSQSIEIEEKTLRSQCCLVFLPFPLEWRYDLPWEYSVSPFSLYKPRFRHLYSLGQLAFFTSSAFYRRSFGYR